ncbi:MAG: modification methylase [Alphaproteobacteria bacterium]|nr:modification methylase [Alphaproteobacteria bacterium]
MPNTNENLHLAKLKKLDEFYTRIEDIEAELKHYRTYFQNKCIFCNCDDPEYSNFWKYFKLNFDFLNLKELIATHYDREKPSYSLRLCKGMNVSKNEPISKKLEQNGDFRSPEAIEVLKSADIVVTNPPFSLFREFIKQLISYNKKFIVLGNINAVTYKEIFPLIKEDKMWIGQSIHSGDREFIIPQKYHNLLKYSKVNDKGQNTVRIKGVRWFTNLDIRKRHEKLILYKHYTPEEYPKYDNYDAINVDKVADIPCDYDGIMGVPITFLDKYNPEQFEIVGNLGAYGIGNYSLCGSIYVKRKEKFKRIAIKRR